MTDFSKTITNSIRVFGIGPATQWGSGMTWGVTKWGEGSTPIIEILFKNVIIANALSSNSEVIRDVRKLLSNSIGSASDLIRTTYKGVSNSVTVTEDLGQRDTIKIIDDVQYIVTDVARPEITKVFDDYVVCSGDMDDAEIFDRDGYCDNFPGGIKNAKDRIWDTWVSSTTAVDGSTADTSPTTSWSDA